MLASTASLLNHEILKENKKMNGHVSITMQELKLLESNREDAYSRTRGIFIRDTARDMAYSLWFNEA